MTTDTPDTTNTPALPAPRGVLERIVALSIRFR